MEFMKHFICCLGIMRTAKQNPCRNKKKQLPLVYLKPLKGISENSEGTYEMSQNATFHQGLHCLLR